MAMLRRFTLANPYELNLPPRLSFDSQHGDQQLQIPFFRERTFSDSVVPAPVWSVTDVDAEEGTPVKRAPQPTTQRRLSWNDIGKSFKRRSRSGSTPSHVTDLLASQTLSLFLQVPDSVNQETSVSDPPVSIRPSSPSLESVAEDSWPEASAPPPLLRNEFLRGKPVRPRRPERISLPANFGQLKPDILDVMGKRSANNRRASGEAAAPTDMAALAARREVDGSDAVFSSCSVHLSTLADSKESNVSTASKDMVVNNRQTSQKDTGQRLYRMKKFSQSTPDLQPKSDLQVNLSASQKLDQPLTQPHYDLNNLGRSKGRQKKFLRLFPSVTPEERVLDYYSCALVGDFLLQGHLYVTHNYFAFHSNVFGYVTKVLIPVHKVVKVSKEKTAKIIPNAIGVTTAQQKHVFGSLLSRDLTWRLMHSIWRKVRGKNGIDEGEQEQDGSSLNGEHSSNESYSQNSTEGLLTAPISPIGIPPPQEAASTSDYDDSPSASPERDDLTNSPRISATLPGSAAGADQRTEWTDQTDKGGGSRRSFFIWHSVTSKWKRFSSSKSRTIGAQDHEVSSENYWAHLGIGILLVILCLSAGLLWYRMHVLYVRLSVASSHHPASPLDNQSQTIRTVQHSVYSPKMQEIIDSLNILLATYHAHADANAEGRQAQETGEPVGILPEFRR